MRAVGLAIALTLFAAGVAQAQTRWDLPAEERGWKLSLDEMTTIAAAWAASAGADGAAMLLAYRKQP